MRAFILLSIILISGIASQSDYQKCIQDLIPVTQELYELDQAIKAKDHKKIQELMEKLKTDGEVALVDCDRAAGGDATPEEVQACVDDLTNLYKTGDEFVTDLKNYDFDAAQKLVPKLQDEITKANQDCSSISYKKIAQMAFNLSRKPMKIAKFFEGLKINIPKCIQDAQQFESDLKGLQDAIQKEDKELINKYLQAVELDSKNIQTDCGIRTAKFLKHIKGQVPTIDDIIDCLEELKPLVSDSEVIQSDIKSKNIDDLVDHIPQTFHDLEKAFGVCKKLNPKALNNPLAVPVINVSTQVEKVEDINDLIKCINDIPPVLSDAQNLEQAIQAEDIKKVIEILPDAINHIETLQADCSKVVVEKNDETNKIDDLITCLNDTVTELKDIEALNDAYQKKDIKTLITLLSKVLTDSQTLTTDCKKVVPVSEVKVNDTQKCIDDVKQLYADVKKAQDDYNNKKFVDFIQDLLAIQNDKDAITTDCKRPSFEAAVSKTCIEDITKLTIEIAALEKDIAAKEIRKIIELVPVVIEETKKTINDCKSQ